MDKDNINELKTIKLRSYLFWSQTLKDAPVGSIAKQCWDKHDYAGYMLFHDNLCPICNNGHLLDTKKDGQALELKGIEIGTVLCVCSSLETLADHRRQRYESESSKFFWSLKKPTTPLGLRQTIYPVAVPDNDAYERTKRIINAFDAFSTNPTRWGFLIGNPGSGKSSMLQALKYRMGGFAYYMAFADFRSLAMRWKSLDLSEVESILVSAPVLLIDDWGIGKDTNFASDMLATVLEKRYIMKRLAPVIMTSNLPQKDLVAKVEVITNKERIISRFLDSEISSLLISTQDDMRRKTTKEAAHV